MPDSPRGVLRWGGWISLAARSWILLAALGTLVTGCAKREPPSGGPPDITPPKVISSSPDSASANVPLDAHLSLTFSEPMEPRSTQESVQLRPTIGFKQRRWSGRTLTLVLDRPMEPDHIYTLSISSSAKDRHGNNMVSGAAFTFSTGAVFPKGQITGEVEAKGFEPAGTYLWIYDAARSGVPDSSGRDFDALGVVDENERFRVSGVKTPGHYRIWAFADLDLNHSYDPDRDVLAPIDTTIDVSDANPVAGPIHLKLVNPRAPGQIQGTVVDSLRDSVGVTRVIAVSAKDSTLIGLADVERGGKWEMTLRAGTWLVRAFQDQDRNRDWKEEREPASDPIKVELEAAGEVRNLKLVLRSRPGSP